MIARPGVWQAVFVRRCEWRSAPLDPNPRVQWRPGRTSCRGIGRAPRQATPLRAHDLIRQDELAHLAGDRTRFRVPRVHSLSRRLGNGIRVERRLENGSAARPEPVADDLVRLRVPHERRAFARWSELSREAGHGQVEAPRKVDGTAFAEEPAPARRERAGPAQGLPAVVRSDRIIRR